MHRHRGFSRTRFKFRCGMLSTTPDASTALNCGLLPVASRVSVLMTDTPSPRRSIRYSRRLAPRTLPTGNHPNMLPCLSGYLPHPPCAGCCQSPAWSCQLGMISAWSGFRASARQERIRRQAPGSGCRWRCWRLSVASMAAGSRQAPPWPPPPHRQPGRFIRQVTSTLFAASTAPLPIGYPASASRRQFMRWRPSRKQPGPRAMMSMLPFPARSR